MHIDKRHLGKKISFKIFFLLVCFCFAYFITSVFVFPSNIKLIEGEKQYFQFYLPFKATLEPESITTLKVNNQKVENNVELDLLKNNELMANETGRANMTLNAFGIPMKSVSLDFLPNTQLVPCGLTVGVQIKTEGIMVLGIGYVNTANQGTVKPAEGVLKPGDVIKKVDGNPVKTKEEFQTYIEQSQGPIGLEIQRDENDMEVSVTPALSVEDGVLKIGMHIRDATEGIGTITYYNPETKKFGALGHGIVDVDTKKLMSVKEGSVYKSIVNEVKRGKKGIPGELVGDIYRDMPIGKVVSNTFLGIYGDLFADSISNLPTEKMPIALQNEVMEGPAKIRANVNGTSIEEYDIYIETVNKYTKDDAKGMVIKITDPRLLDKTNGIVQGMSGSPIIQNHKLVGAVTHVFIQEPTKGYGIFIENMLKQEHNNVD